MINRRDLLAGGGAFLGAAGLIGGGAVIGENISNAQTAAPGAPSLKSLAAARGILFGSAFANYELKDADFVPVLRREAAILVPEYEMKRNLVEPRPGVYDFSATDALMDFAARNNMLMRGHTLCWYAANPPWLDDAVRNARDDKLLTGYIAAVAGRYRGRMHSLDVVNEAVSQDGKGLRDSIWLKKFGPTYIDLAFHAARAADPEALLTYNDYGAEPGGDAGDRFRAATLNLLDGMIARGVPVQAYGMQGHLSAFGAHVDQRKLRAFVGELEARKLTILITEMDVADEDGPYGVAARDQAVADETTRFLDVMLDSKATRALLTWSLSDRYLDPPDSTRLRLMGWRDRRVPYDSAMRPKPMRDAIARALVARRPPFSGR